MEGNELYHHGILGQKWGIRRFQNSDGSLTEAGRERYSVGEKAKDVAKKTGTAIREYRVKRAIKTGKGLGLLSDEELDRALTRRNKEVNYRRAVETLNPPKVRRGKSIIIGVLERTLQKSLDKMSDNFVNRITVFKDPVEEDLKELEFENRFKEAKMKDSLNVAKARIYDEWSKEYNSAKTSDDRDKANDRLRERLGKLPSGGGKKGNK